MRSKTWLPKGPQPLKRPRQCCPSCSRPRSQNERCVQWPTTPRWRAFRPKTTFMAVAANDRYEPILTDDARRANGHVPPEATTPGVGPRRSLASRSRTLAVRGRSIVCLLTAARKEQPYIIAAKASSDTFTVKPTRFLRRGDFLRPPVELGYISQKFPILHSGSFQHSWHKDLSTFATGFNRVVGNQSQLRL